MTVTIMRQEAGTITNAFGGPEACTITELEKTKNLQTGIMAPISFGTGVRFSNQKLQIMQAEFSTLSFKPVN